MKKQQKLFEQRFADFSEDRRYRYSLKIVWDESKPLLVVIGLNPSKADETDDDNTVRRWKMFARVWGFGGIVILNLFALVSTDPKGLLGVEDPVGPLNTMYRWQSEMMNAQAQWALACWGRVHRKLKHQEDLVKLMFPGDLMCLGKNKDHSPVHPLYQPSHLKPIPYRA